MEHYRAITLSNVLQENVSAKDVVLDLGCYSSGTTAAFLKKKCRCFVEDIPELIENFNQNNKNISEEAFKQHLMVLDQTVKFDVVLAWDLFHYLSLESIGTLFRLLKDKFKPNTLLHLMRYTGRHISNKPAVFKFHSDFSYERTFDPKAKSIENNPHATVKLLMKINDFELDNALMNRVGMEKGMSELLLKCSGGHYSVKQQAEKIKQLPPILMPIKIQTSRLKLPNLVKQLKCFSKNKASRILDCSPHQINHLECLEKISHQVVQEDLYTRLTWLKKMVGEKSSSLGQRMLRYDKKDKFNLVLLWDLFNFCSEEQIISLGARLAQYINADSYIHIVIARSGGVAERPAEFYFEQDDDFLESELQPKISILGDINGERTNSVQSTSRLIHLLPLYSVVAYYLGTLSNGENYQEFLFRFKGP